MAKEETKDKKINENFKCHSFGVVEGFKFGFGMFIAFLAGSAILTVIAIGFYYLSNLI